MESASVNELIKWADWAAFNRYKEIVKNVLNIWKQRGISAEKDAPFEKRLKFFGYDKSNTVGLDWDIAASLNHLEVMRQEYCSQCKTSDTSEFQFLFIRQMTLVQACIAMLYNQLDIPLDKLPPDDPRDIKLPATFSLAQFSDDVVDIYQKNKVYSSNVMLGKVEDEFHKNAHNILVDIFRADEDGKISKERVKSHLHYLLHQYPFSKFTASIASFSHKVECQVLPCPIVPSQTALSVVGSFSSLSSSVLNPTEEQVVIAEEVDDWSENSGNINGPYASPSPRASNRHPPSTKKKQIHEKQLPLAEKSFTKSPVEESNMIDLDSATPPQKPLTPVRVTRSKSRAICDDEVENVTSKLRETNKAFKSSNRAKDPLQEALDVPSEKKTKVVSRVESVVGQTGRKGRKSPSPAKRRGKSPRTDDMDEIEDTKSENVSPVTKKKRRNSSKSITSARTTATVVEFSEDESESEVKESNINKKRAQLEAQQQGFTKFPKKLEGASRSPSSKHEFPAHTNLNRTRWTSDEEDALLEGVEKHGTSAWATIRDDAILKYRFNNRTNTNLKDKYRNLQLKGVVDN